MTLMSVCFEEDVEMHGVVPQEEWILTVADAHFEPW